MTIEIDYWLCYHDQPSELPPDAVKSFAAVRESREMAALLTVFRQFGEQDTKEAVNAIVYAGLTKPLLDGLSTEQTQQVFQTAREALLGMTDERVWKATYKATYQHPECRIDSGYPDT